MAQVFLDIHRKTITIIKAPSPRPEDRVEGAIGLLGGSCEYCLGFRVGNCEYLLISIMV